MSLPSARLLAFLKDRRPGARRPPPCRCICALFEQGTPRRASGGLPSMTIPATSPPGEPGLDHIRSAIPRRSRAIRFNFLGEIVSTSKPWSAASA